MMDFENSMNPFEERRARIADWRELVTVKIESDSSIVIRAA